jgi:hypothetical protein
MVTKEFLFRSGRRSKTVLLWGQVSIHQRRFATTALPGLAPAHPAPASAANHWGVTSARHCDLGVANDNVTVTDYAFPQHSCAPARRACEEQKSSRKQFRNCCRPKQQAFSWFSPNENHASPPLSGHRNCESALNRVRSVRPLDRAVLTTWRTPDPPHQPEARWLGRRRIDGAFINTWRIGRMIVPFVCHRTDRVKGEGSATLRVRRRLIALIALFALFFRKLWTQSLSPVLGDVRPGKTSRLSSLSSLFSHIFCTGFHFPSREKGRDPTQAKRRLEWAARHLLPVWQKLWRASPVGLNLNRLVLAEGFKAHRALRAHTFPAPPQPIWSC